MNERFITVGLIRRCRILVVLLCVLVGAATARVKRRGTVSRLCRTVVEFQRVMQMCNDMIFYSSI